MVRETRMDDRANALPHTAGASPHILDEAAPGAGPDRQVIAALTGHDAPADRALSLRTRRAVYNAVMDQRTDREQGRKNLVIALLLTGGLTIALAPALWSGIDDMLAGETLLDLPGMLVALGMTLFGAVAAGLFLLGGDRQTLQTVRNRASLK